MVIYEQAVELQILFPGTNMSRSNENPRSGIDPTIIAALIGVMGTVCVTAVTLYISNFGPNLGPQPTAITVPTEITPSAIIESPTLATSPTALEVATWTASPTATIPNTPLPTDTVPVGDPSSTPAPDTPTPEMTFTPAPPAIGSDWSNGCISALWRPYPDTIQTTAINGCLVEPVDTFFAADGRLTFQVSGRYDNTEVHGLFARLPASGRAQVHAYLINLQEGEVWIGVFAEPNIESDGMVIVIPPGDVRNRPLVQKRLPGQNEINRTQAFQRNPPLYDVVFEFANGGVTTRILNDTVFNAVPVGSGQQWLFLGYRIRNGNNRIDAEFLNLVVQGQ